VDFSKNRAFIVAKDKSKEFIKLLEAQKSSEKNKKFWAVVEQVTKEPNKEEK